MSKVRNDEFSVGSQHPKSAAFSAAGSSPVKVKYPQSRYMHFKNALRADPVDNRTGSTSYSYGVN